ncbi:hypothetical protein [Streptococcus henryi]|nr:hypothetical protein [Streptococcus henryi]
MLTVIFSITMGYTQKAHADHYSAWVIISTSGVKEKKIVYNGAKQLIQLYQEVKYRRTYTDNAGRTSYQYKTEIRKLGLKSPYS